MRSRHLMPWLCCLTLAGCGETAIPTDPDSTATGSFRMEAGADGSLQYCDASGQCRDLSNPDDCAVLVVTVENTTGRVCERCEAEDGSVIYDRCDGSTGVACVVVTVPEPDCVVCAWVDGSIVYSSCVVDESGDCELFEAADGGECRVCRDASGRVILDECQGDCDGVVCPAMACAPGFVAVTRPGACCPVCEPADECTDVCAMETILPDCPDSTWPARDPANCCDWICVPYECPPLNAEYPRPDCPPGYVLSMELPDCGRCVPAEDPARYCAADSDCAQGELCTVSNGDCLTMQPCGCFEECDADGTCSATCVDCACHGVCVPAGWECPLIALPPPEACQGGDWMVPGRDAMGCPLPPVCVCPDGAVAVDGICTDLCAQVDCIAVLPECEPGFHPEYAYPHCCGMCVPDDPCAEHANICLATDCMPGTHCELGPDCEVHCAPDAQYCRSDLECGAGEICTTMAGDCLPPPNGGAQTVCYGVCVPAGCDFDSDCPPGSHCEGSSVCPPDVQCVWAGEPGICVADARVPCAGSEECGSGERCSTERGVCEQAPSCSDPDMACIDLCYGVCEPIECDPAMCGPAPGMPTYLCADGHSIAGSTGRCIQLDTGACGWEILSCP